MLDWPGAMSPEDTIRAVLGLVSAPSMSEVLDEMCRTAEPLAVEDEAHWQAVNRDLGTMVMTAIMLVRDVQEIAPEVAAAVLEKWALCADDLVIGAIERGLGATDDPTGAAAEWAE